METIYKCKVCGKLHTCPREAISCRKSHKIIPMDNNWLIPFIGWYKIAYNLIRYRNEHPVISFGYPCVKNHLKQSIVLFSPIVVIMGIILYLY